MKSNKWSRNSFSKNRKSAGLSFKSCRRNSSNAVRRRARIGKVQREKARRSRVRRKRRKIQIAKEKTISILGLWIMMSKSRPAMRKKLMILFLKSNELGFSKSSSTKRRKKRGSAKKWRNWGRARSWLIRPPWTTLNVKKRTLKSRRPEKRRRPGYERRNERKSRKQRGRKLEINGSRPSPKAWSPSMILVLRITRMLRIWHRLIWLHGWAPRDRRKA